MIELNLVVQISKGISLIVHRVVGLAYIHTYIWIHYKIFQIDTIYVIQLNFPQFKTQYIINKSLEIQMYISYRRHRSSVALVSTQHCIT